MKLNRQGKPKHPKPNQDAQNGLVRDDRYGLGSWEFAEGVATTNGCWPFEGGECCCMDSLQNGSRGEGYEVQRIGECWRKSLSSISQIKCCAQFLVIRDSAHAARRIGRRHEVSRIVVRCWDFGFQGGWMARIIGEEKVRAERAGAHEKRDESPSANFRSEARKKDGTQMNLSQLWRNRENGATGS